MKENADSKKIIDDIKEMSKKYIASSSIEKSVYISDYRKKTFFNDFKTIHYFDDGMMSLSKQSRFLYNFFDEKFTELLYESFEKRDCEIITKLYPVLLPIESYKKTGYLKRTPQYSMFCCSLYEDFKYLNSIGEIENNEYREVMNNPEYALSPSACFHVYEELKNEKLACNTVVTFTQSVFRNEGRFNFKEFGRMRDYHVREIVFIGDMDFVSNSREIMIDKIKEFIEIIKLDASITVASDPFILPKMQKFKKLQVIDNSKYELRLSYNDNKDMSVGSFNLHGTAFTQPFNISVEGKETVTGCIGFGLERFVLSFLSQYGEDDNQWPDLIKKEYKKAQEC